MRFNMEPPQEKPIISVLNEIKTNFTQYIVESKEYPIEDSPVCRETFIFYSTIANLTLLGLLHLILVIVLFLMVKKRKNRPAFTKSVSFSTFIPDPKETRSPEMSRMEPESARNQNEVVYAEVNTNIKRTDVKVV